MPIDQVPYRRAIYVAIGVCTLTAALMFITPRPVICFENIHGKWVCAYERAPDACGTDTECELGLTAANTDFE